MKGLKSSDAISFGKPHLMQSEFRTNNDNRTARIVNTFTKQVLTETSLFSFQTVDK